MIKIIFAYFHIIILTIIIPIEVGYGDVTYNSRRGILGVIPSTERIVYHLFAINAGASNTKDIVQFNRKSKWYSQYNTREGN